MLAKLHIETVVSSLFHQNAYVIWREGNPDALVVDPGFDPDAIVRLLKREGLQPEAILNTHGHTDHIAGNEAILSAYPGTPIVIGRNEAHLLTDANANLSATHGITIVSPPADRLVDDGERLELAGVSMLVREIPGHSPGSVVFIIDGEEPPQVIAGDVLFAGSIGRCDFPGGSQRTLVTGIQSKLFVLPDDSVIWPGHGPTTTVGEERETNPYCGEY